MVFKKYLHIEKIKEIHRIVFYLQSNMSLSLVFKLPILHVCTVYNCIPVAVHMRSIKELMHLI